MKPRERLLKFNAYRLFADSALPDAQRSATQAAKIAFCRISRPIITVMREHRA
jgi:hypothetical protein